MNDLISVNVRIEKDQMITDSRNVSDVFNKRHDNVLRDIENIKIDVLNFEEMFFETTMPDSYGRAQKVYFMNRDGFTLLAMGFTGAEAMKWKLKYIEAFNALEKAWNTPEQIMARALKLADQTISKLNEKIEEQRPLVEFAEHVSESSDTVDMGEMAKIAVSEKIKGIGRNRLIDWMKEKGFLMGDGKPYQRYVDQGLMKVVDVTKKTPYGSRIFTKTVFTGKGQIWITELLRTQY